MQQDLDLPNEGLDPEAAIEAAAGLRDAATLGRWPERLLEIVDVFEATLARTSMKENNRSTAEHLALALANNQGGKPLYLPFGARDLAPILRARRIYNRLGQADGQGGRWTMEALAEAEGICVQTAYKDYGLIRSIESKRRQPKLL